VHNDLLVWGTHGTLHGSLRDQTCCSVLPIISLCGVVACIYSIEASTGTGLGAYREVSGILATLEKTTLLTSNPLILILSSIRSSVHKSCALRLVVTGLETSVYSLAVSSLVLVRCFTKILRAFDFPHCSQRIRETSAAIAVVVTIGVDAPSILCSRRMEG
jgi:hypothetical protein